MATAADRRRPNVLVTGTPGCGKTTLCELLMDQLPEALTQSSADWDHVDISALVKDQHLHEGWDEEFKCHILDEDKVLDHLEERMAQGGVIIDHHGCDWFPERWFDIVIVLRTENTVLFDRLAARGYTGKKLENNIDCEIFGTIVSEANESYAEEIVTERPSNTAADMEANVTCAAELCRQWLAAR